MRVWKKKVKKVQMYNMVPNLYESNDYMVYPSDSRTPTSTETIHINLRLEQVPFGWNKDA